MNMAGNDGARRSKLGLFSPLLVRLRQRPALRSVGLLVGGTASAHAITALSMPIVTRLYTPADMSLLAVFSSLLLIFYVSICLRFDIAVPLPERDEEAVNLLAAGAFSATVLSFGLMIVALALPMSAYQRFGYEGFAPYAWMLPPASFIAGLYSLGQFWFVRRRAFGLIAQSRISQSAASAGTQLGMGAIGFGPIGLILGQILNSGAGFAILGARLVQRERALLSTVSFAGMRRAWRAYYRFPRYSAAEALANTAGIQLPVVLIAGMAAGPEAGYLMLALYVMQAPMSLIGTAVGQVYLSHAPDRYRAASLGVFTADVLGGLMRAGVGPLIFIGIVSPFVFGYVFGSDWSRAGVLVSWMTPWFVMQFLTTPVSMGLHVTNHQRTALYLQMVGLVMRVGLVWVAGSYSSHWVSEAYAISGFVFYVLYFVVVIARVGCEGQRLMAAARSAFLPVSGWAVCGMAVAFAAHELGPML
jgi:O-antigen/teichoic acid export membrane protein